MTHMDKEAQVKAVTTALVNAAENAVRKGLRQGFWCGTVISCCMYLGFILVNRQHEVTGGLLLGAGAVLSYCVLQLSTHKTHTFEGKQF